MLFRSANFYASGVGIIDVFGTVSTYGNATFFNTPVITGNATVLTNGHIIGDEWADADTTSPNWGNVSPSVEGWIPSSTAEPSWGTVTTASNVWTSATPTDSEWLRQ